MQDNEVIDRTIPDSAWKFDEGVTAVFDNMLARSIPQYEIMRKACYDLACKFRQKNTEIIDLGCSRGEAIAELIEKWGAGNRFIGIEISDPMLEACRARFQGYINCNVVDIRKFDLRYSYPEVMASVTLCILTLNSRRLSIASESYEISISIP